MNFAASEKLFFYLNSKWKSPVFSMHFEFRKDIDFDKFKEALRKTLVIFPRMKSQPVVDEDGHIGIIENDNDVPVYYDDGKPKMLGTEETGYYLFRCAIDGKKLRVNIFHALGDARMMTFFLKQVFLYYLEQTENVDISSYVITKEEARGKEYTESLVDKAEEYLSKKKGLKAMQEKDMRPAFFADEGIEYLSTPKACGLELSWDSEALSKLVHKYNTTPLVLIHTLLAQVYLEIYGCADEVIRCGFAVDLRGRLNSKSQANFGYDASMVYEKQWKDRPLEEQFVLVGEALRKALDLERMSQNIKEQEDYARAVVSMVTLGGERMEALLAEKLSRHETTYFISNLAKTDFMQDSFDYLKSFRFLPIPFLNTVDYYMSSFGDKGRIFEVKNYRSTAVFERLKDKLEKLGLNCEIIETGLFENDRMDVSLIKTIH